MSSVCLIRSEQTDSKLKTTDVSHLIPKYATALIEASRLRGLSARVGGVTFRESMNTSGAILAED
jgi:hypothetical protein